MMCYIKLFSGLGGFSGTPLKGHLRHATSPRLSNEGTASDSLRRLLTVSVAACAAGKLKIANAINKKRLGSGGK